MNQILHSQNNYANNYYYNDEYYSQNQEQKYYNNRGEIKKILVVFSIFLLLFGGILIGKGIYFFYKKETSKEDIITVKYEQEANELKVKISGTLAVQKFTYSWNGAQEVIVVGNGTETLEERISIPSRGSLIKISVYDYYGNKTIYQGQFQNLSDENDREKPVIDIQTANKQLVVTARDNAGIKYIKYKWTDGEWVTKKSETGEKELKVEIDVAEGKNDITIVTEDINNNKEEMTQKIVGTKKPEVTLKVDNATNEIIIIAKDTEGIAKVTLQVDETLQDTGDAPLNEKEISARIPLSLGRHTIIVTVKNIHGREEVIEKTVEM